MAVVAISRRLVAGFRPCSRQEGSLSKSVRHRGSEQSHARVGARDIKPSGAPGLSPQCDDSQETNHTRFYRATDADRAYVQRDHDRESSPIEGETQEVREDRESTHEPAPAGALDGGRGRVELLDEGVDGAPVLLDGGLEGAGVDGTTVALALRLGRREVLPEERVVDVPCGYARAPRSGLDWSSSRRATPILEKFTHHRR